MAGWGGSRRRAGRKPTDKALQALRGGKPRQAAVTVPVVAVMCPETASEQEQAAWLELEPQARAAGKLTPETAMAFWLLVQNVVLERVLRASDPGSPNHRGMQKLVIGLYGDFCLRPDGKRVAVVAQAVDEWAEFDGPQLVKKGA